MLLHITPCLYLLVGTVTDLRHRTVPPVWSALAAICSIVIRLLIGTRITAWDLTALLPGLLFLAIAFVSRGGIGGGDALAILILGLTYPFSEVICILMLALSGAALYAGFLFARDRHCRNRQFPFIPFLFAGLCGTIVWKGVFA